MNIQQIKKLKNFSIGEKDTQGREIFSRASEIDNELMEHADYAVTLAKRYFPKTRFIVHDINLGEHSKGSWHYLGGAIDGHFEGLSLPLQFFFMVLAGFKGIGIYPEWQTPGVHADIRDQDNISAWYAYYVNENGRKVQEYEYNRLKLAKELGLCT